MSLKQGENPFKGLYSYEERDKDIFYGRDREGKELFKLVKLNLLTVVLGKSGIGKTSLINAGLFPLLREMGFLPIKLGLDYSPPPLPLLPQVVQAIQKELTNHDIREMEKGRGVPAVSFGERETLWEYFHRVEHVDRSGNRVTPVLVLDQFEELFTIGRNHPDREALKEELYYLVEDKVPDALQAQPGVRVVLGLREDYLPHFNSLKRQIPSIDRVLFRVLHLNGPQAREVIGMPGGFKDEGIKQDILRQFYPEDMEPEEKAADEQLEVEPALLSLLCYKIFEKGAASLSGQEKNAILSDFYDEILWHLPRGKDVVEFIETRLLTEVGFRTPLYLDRDHKLRGALEKAINLKILRKFYIGEKEHVEIIHDVLAPVIKEKRNRRLEEKKQQELQKKLRQKRIIIGIIFAGIVSLLLAWFAFVQKNQADRQYKEAVLQENRADKFYKELVAEKNRANKLYKESIAQKKRADELDKKIGAREKRADKPYKKAGVREKRPYRQYKASVIDRLITASGLILAKDYIKAIRIAEAAYKMSMPHPSPRVMRALSTAVYSTFERFSCTVSLKHEGEVTTAVFSPDSSKILTASADKTAKLWDLRGNVLADLNQHKGWVNSAVFSPDGSKILTAARDKTAKLWDLNGNVLADLNQHRRWVSCAVFSPDGSKILTASVDNTAKLWDLQGNVLADLNQHTGWVISAVFSPDGSKILTAARDKTAKLWDLNGNVLADLNQHKGWVNSAVFSPDGSKILTVSWGWDRTAKLWDLKGKLLADLNTHVLFLSSAVFSPDGSKILTASADKTAKLWDLKGNVLANLNKHTYFVTSAVFSPDGGKILTASQDKTAKLWDLRGNLLADLNNHIGWVNSAVFSPDGTRILTASGDDTAKIWPTPEAILEWLKTDPIHQLSKKDKEELGIADFEID
jgi:WD40 repeat protein